MDLKTAREKIDVLDRELLRILGERLSVVRALGAFKQENHLEIIDLAREDALQKLHHEWAMEYKLDPLFVNHLFEEIFTHTRAVQGADSSSKKG